MRDDLMASPLLEVNRLSLQFMGQGRAHALSDLTLQVAAGEVLGLIGESGSGKSVLLRALLRLHPAATTRVQGQVRVDGEDVLTMPPAALRRLRGGVVSMIFQEPGLAFDPVYTIGDQISEVVRAHTGMDRRAARQTAFNLLERVRIPQARRRLDTYPHELSGGMRQRAMIALALSCQPRLLLADEPTTALDSSVQAQILALLADLQQESGMAVMLVTHDIAAAAAVAGRVAVMYAGRIVESASVALLLEDPRHPYSQGLLASARATSGRARGQALPVIAGAPPDLRALPAGCAFAERCPQAQARCHAEAPPTQEAAGRTLACWAVDLPGAVLGADAAGPL